MPISTLLWNSVSRSVVVGLIAGLATLTASAATLASARPRTSHPRSGGFSTARITDDQKRVCVYDHNYVNGLARFAKLVDRRTVDCAMVYTGSPNWSGWVNPWFLHDGDANLDWADWVRRSPRDDRRQLIISQPLIPSDLAHTNWLRIGASGGYAKYARAFARALVTAGVPDAVIRLSWEMNGDWNLDSIPDTSGGDRLWVRFWRRTVLAMRSVRGARFTFVWCPNNGYRSIPLRDYYPGDAVVDIIGDDVYDSGVPRGDADRWRYIDDRSEGLRTIVAFARRHRKPLSFPEWGVGPASSEFAGGDDGHYVQQLARVVDDEDVAFQAYFFRYGWAAELRGGRRSLTAYRQAFGRHGYAAGPDDGTDVTPQVPVTRSHGRRETARRRRTDRTARRALRSSARRPPATS